MKIRLKILSAFILLISLIFIAGIFSIHELYIASNKMKSLIENNYRTIIACDKMTEALEREDSGILLLLMGDRNESILTINKADSAFQLALKAAASNLTEHGEDKHVKNIDSAYKIFKHNISYPLIDSQFQTPSDWYLNKIHPLFVTTKQQIRELRHLNETSMYKEAEHLKNKKYRATMPSLIAIISAVVLLIILNYYINHYFVTPFEKIIKRLDNLSPYERSFNVGIETDNEFKKLEQSIHNLLQRIEKGKE